MPSLGTGRVVRPQVGMECPQKPSPAAAGANPRTAEVLYLLSRGAQLQHPHMISVPFAAHQPGPTLRDVKARLVALRGKGMPDSFSWSYKRNYKDSFIWCDLFDDDFILPLNVTGEYVLKALELFDASTPGEEMAESHEPRFRGSYRVSSPGRASRALARPELRHVENDVSTAIKKSLLLINTPGDSMDLNKGIMSNLPFRKRAPQACSVEHSDVSSGTAAYPSFEDTVESNEMSEQSPKISGSATKTDRHRQCSSQRSSLQTAAHTQAPGSHPSSQKNTDLEAKEPEKEHPESRQSIGSRVAIAKCCNGAGSHTAKQRQQRRDDDVTPDCCNSEQLENNGRSKPPSPAKTNPSLEAALAKSSRRTWEKEIDKSTICTQLVSHRSYDDEQQHPSPRSELLGTGSAESGHAACLSEPDPFFFGVLRRATRLGSSFRPRLCRGVDVVDSACTKTKLQFRSKSSKHVDDAPKPALASAMCLKSSTSAKHSSGLIAEPDSQSPRTTVKELKTLSEYFEAQELTNTAPDSRANSETNEEIVAPVAQDPASDPLSDLWQAPVLEVLAPAVPLKGRRPFGNNEALDASYRKTMEVLAKLPPPRSACRTPTSAPQPKSAEAGVQKITRSESKGNKQQEVMKKVDTCRSSSKQQLLLLMSTVSAPSSRQSACKAPPGCEDDGGGILVHEPCAIHDMGSASPPAPPVKQQRTRPSVQKAAVSAGFEASTVSCRAKAVVKTGSEDSPTIKTPRSRGSKQESRSCAKLEQAGDVTMENSTSKPPQQSAAESFSFAIDSCALQHSGNKQQGSSKMGAQVAPRAVVDVVASSAAAAAAAPEVSSDEAAKGWPFEQPVRPRDFKSREDRPLTPGLTNVDWERSFQEAVIQCEPPVDMVLHECSQCGRTFKLESLQVHKRGCHAASKPKSTSPSQRRVSL